MNFYKIKLAYDGTDYQGWQEQKNSPTISGTLKKTFVQTFNKNVSIVGASRTDAGVHALGQIARITTELEIDPTLLLKAWSNKLPYDIAILDCQKVTKDFHPMKNVLRKIYHYDFFIQRPLPFNCRYGLHFRWHLDIEKLKNCLDFFKGAHDFRSFATGYEMKSTIRTIDNIELKKIDMITYRIEITGKSFLYHMIRRIVGACLEVASRPNIDINYIKTVLDLKNPEHTLPNAAAKGLLLYNIEYFKE